MLLNIFLLFNINKNRSEKQNELICNNLFLIYFPVLLLTVSQKYISTQYEIFKLIITYMVFLHIIY